VFATSQHTRQAEFLPGAGLIQLIHCLRHWFITGLARAGVSPKMAQTLARHWDIRLTLCLHTHAEMPDRSAAIESPPPGMKREEKSREAHARRRRKRAARRITVAQKVRSS
jgi:hypothetical protein